MEAKCAKCDDGADDTWLDRGHCDANRDRRFRHDHATHDGSGRAARPRRRGGRGFGGLSAAKSLADTRLRRHRRRSAQLSPVPAAALPGGDRRRCRRPTSRRRSAASCAGRRTSPCVLAEVTGIDTAAQERHRRGPHGIGLRLSGRSPPARATPISATTTGPSFAPGLKTHRRCHRFAPPHPARVRARRDRDRPRERDALLTFVVIGGGPTGVEMAGAIAELARNALANGFPLDRSRATRACCWSKPGRAARAVRSRRCRRRRDGSLEQLGVDVRARHAASPTCDCRRRLLGDERIEAANHRLGRRRPGIAGWPQWLGVPMRPRRAGHRRSRPHRCPGIRTSS